MSVVWPSRTVNSPLSTYTLSAEDGGKIDEGLSEVWTKKDKLARSDREKRLAELIASEQAMSPR